MKENIDILIPSVEVGMTLTEEAKGVNPMGGPGFRYTAVSYDMESALRLCEAHRNGVINASVRCLRDWLNTQRQSLPPHYRPLNELDFILRFGDSTKQEELVEELAYATS